MQSFYSRYNIENTKYWVLVSLSLSDKMIEKKHVVNLYFSANKKTIEKCIKIINFWFCSSVSQTYDWRIILIFFSVAHKKETEEIEKEVYLEWLLKDAAEWKSSRRLNSTQTRKSIIHLMFLFPSPLRDRKIYKNIRIGFSFSLSSPPKHSFYSFFLCVLHSIQTGKN